MRIPSRNKYEPKELTDHTNYINSKGILVPSVTTVLKVIPKEALMQWANSLGWKKKSLNKELDTSSEIGTIFHECAEVIFNNRENEVDSILRTASSDEILNKALKSLISFRKWYKENSHRIRPLYTELSMSGERYGGTTDLVCYLDDILTIVDYKTSGNFYFTMFMQLSAYVKLYKEIYGIEPEEVAVLRVDKKNGDKAKLLRMSDVEYGDIDFYYDVFEKALDLYSSLNVLKRDWHEI